MPKNVKTTYLLAYWEPSPKCIDREGLKRRRTGTRQVGTQGSLGCFNAPAILPI